MSRPGGRCGGCFLKEEGTCGASMMDPGVVHHKADLSVPDSRAVVNERLKVLHKISGFEGSLFHSVENDSFRGDAH